MARSRGVSPSLLVVAAPGTADHDLVLLDRDLHRTVPGPVLGVDGVVLHVGVQPEAVALLAVVERPLQRASRRAPPRAPAAAARAARLGVLVRAALLLGLALGLRLARRAGLRLGRRAGLRLGRLAGGLLGRPGLLCGAALRLRLELGGDGGVVLRAEVDLVGGGAGLVAVGLQAVLALE